MRVLLVCVLLCCSTIANSAGLYGGGMSSRVGGNTGSPAFPASRMGTTSAYLNASSNYSSYYSKSYGAQTASTTYGETPLINAESTNLPGLRTDGPPPPIIKPEDELPLGDAALPLILSALAYVVWQKMRKQKPTPTEVG